MNAALQDPLFEQVTRRLKSPECTDMFLDMGCCLGQMLRYLTTAGVPSERLYGIDVQQRFLDLGYELFRDRDTSKATFVCGNMLDTDDRALEQLEGSFDVIYAASFFHLFELEEQKKVAKRIISLLKPDSPDALIFGCNGGPKIKGWENYVLREEIWRNMWHEIAQETGTSWKIEMTVEEGEGDIRIVFAVYRR